MAFGGEEDIRQRGWSVGQQVFSLNPAVPSEQQLIPSTCKLRSGETLCKRCNADGQLHAWGKTSSEVAAVFFQRWRKRAVFEMRVQGRMKGAWFDHRTFMTLQVADEVRRKPVEPASNWRVKDLSEEVIFQQTDSEYLGAA